MYLDEIASSIKANIPADRIPDGDVDDLLLIYAVLLRAKGPNVTSSDVHDAWSAWMKGRDRSHAALVPFASLSAAVQKQDQAFAAAVQKTANELGLTGDTRSEFDKVLFPGGPPSESPSEAQLLELYKMMVASSEGLVARRLGVNTYFLTMNGALVTAMGIIFQNSRGDKLAGFGVAAMAFTGLILGLAWRSLITSFGQLNRGKFKVIHSLERHLRASIYAAEWEALARGEDAKIYRSFTSREIWVPNALTLLYLVATVLAMLFGFGKLDLP